MTFAPLKKHMVHIAIATTDADIQRCFPVMQQLRPHLVAGEFVTRIRRQEKQGYHLSFLETENRIRALGGFRIAENLAWGKFLYVDDLVTDEGDRAHGYGTKLIEWLIVHAKNQHCDQFHLDSGVQRFEAHRFYMNRGMRISSYHFALALSVR